MIGILLTIMKIIGIVVLVILGIILLLILMILFSPLRYRADADYHGQLQAEARVSWLFHLIRVRAGYTQDGPFYSVKLLFFTLLGSDKKKKPQKQKKTKRKRKDSRQKKQDARKKPEPDRIQPDRKQLTDGQKNDSEPGQKPEKKSFISKFTDKIKGFCDTIKRAQNKAAAVLAAGQEKAEKVRNFVEDEQNKRLFHFLLQKALKIWKRVKPRKFRMNLHFGTGDPADTGRIVGAIAVFYGFTGLYIQLEPDFEEKVLEGDLSVKGRFHLAGILLLALQIYRNKDFRKVILKKDAGTSGRRRRKKTAGQRKKAKDRS